MNFLSRYKVMNKKITFPELIEAVAATTETSKRTSEMFLKELFAVVSEALVKGENVKIKNFGVFKLTEVGERKSVNVNTGEEMKIPSHTKVSFSPDKSLADAINMPFSSFEAVELSDNITEDDLIRMTSPDLPDENNTDISPIEEDVNGINKPKDTEEHIQTGVADVDKSEVTADSNETHGTEIEAATKMSESDAAEHDNVGMVAPCGVSEPLETAKEEARQNNAAEPYKENNEEKSVSSQGKSVQEEDSLDEIRRQLENRYVSPYKSALFFKGYFWGAVTMLLLSAVAFYSYYLYNEENKAYEEAVDFALRNQVPRVSEEIVKVEDNKAEIMMEPDSAAYEATNNLHTDDDEESEVSVRDVQKDVARYDTVSRSRYLTTMSREYYGDFRFWVYIYEENKSKIDNPNSIAPGTVVEIPLASKYGIDKNDRESIEKAKKMAVSILNEHK